MLSPTEMVFSFFLKTVVCFLTRFNSVLGMYFSFFYPEGWKWHEKKILFYTVYVLYIFVVNTSPSYPEEHKN